MFSVYSVAGNTREESLNRLSKKDLDSRSLLVSSRPVVFFGIIFLLFLTPVVAAQDGPCGVRDDDYQLLEDGLVEHISTGLVWKRCREGQLWENEACTEKPDFITWKVALSYPGTVNASGGYGGFTDWRLPNLKELMSIVEEGCYNPAFNESIFFVSQYTEDAWSSTANLDFEGEGRAWQARYDFGSPHLRLRTDSVSGVRLVRGGK